MTFPAGAVRFATATLVFLGALASRAESQAPAPTTASGVTPTPRVVWTPGDPRQGSVVRITVLPGAGQDTSGTRGSRAPDSLGRGDTAAPARADSIARARADSIARADTLARRDTTMNRDSLPTVTVALGVRLDSLRAVLDTMPLRTAADSVSARADSLGRTDVRDTLPGVADGPVVRATLFGEPLHFERDSLGALSALAAIPVDAPASVNLTIVIARAGGEDTLVARLPIRRTAYKMEQLKVAPRFGQAPDSVLAARIAREQALAADVSRKSHQTPRLWKGEFQRPRTARVTSAFGDGRQFNGRIQSRHMGLDLAGAVGAPVLATNRGVVALVGDFYYAGNAVYIDHGAGLVTAYFHLSAVNVAQGDTVTPGMRIGSVGATGRVAGPHLHWVARYGAVTVDPSTLLEIMPAPANTKPTEKPATSPAPGSGAVDSTRKAASPPPRHPAG